MTEFASNLSELAASVQQEEVMKDLLGNFKILHDDLESNKFASLPLFRYIGSAMQCNVMQCNAMQCNAVRSLFFHYIAYYIITPLSSSTQFLYRGIL